MSIYTRATEIQKLCGGFVEESCNHCDGCGLVNNHVCKVCNGHGVLVVTQNGETNYKKTDEQIRAVNTLGGVE